MAGSFTEWVRNRSDDELLELLAARPDLGTPAPSTLRSLAARAASRTSLDRALSHLDAGTLQVLESLLALSDDGTPARPEQVAAAIGAPEAGAAVGHVLDDARRAALVWDDADGVRPTPGLEDVLGPYPAGLGPVREGEPPAPAELPPGAQPILDALAWGPPVGVVPAPGTGPRRAVDALVEAGLLIRSDARHVLLPRDVGLSLRAGRTHRTPDLDPPRPEGRTVPTAGADAEAATAALEIVRQVARLITSWDDAPPSVLRAGGLGVRDVRRTALLLDTDEPTAAFVVELAASAGLVADDGEAPASYVPTVRADTWEQADDADRWAELVAAWTASRRTPWQVGSRDEKGTLRAPLSPDLHRPWVVRLRAAVLDVLAAQPGTALGPDEVMTVLRWRSPRAVPSEAALVGLLREAALLGVTGAGALSSPGHLVAAGDGTRATIAAALRQVLPAEVDEVLLQGDLTGIVPGRPSPGLSRLLDQSADIESRGAATTVRFSTGSVTRALDHGRTGEELLAELAGRSPVPVPQPLEYLVKDTARRHEAVRVGSATSYVRAADPTALAGLAEDPRLAGLGLLPLAPTVLASSVPAAELHDTLRRHGLLSGLEGPDGRPLGHVRRTVRLDRAAWSRRPATPVRDTSADARAAVVARLRRATPGSDGPGTGTGAPLGAAEPSTVPDGGTPDRASAADRDGPPLAGTVVGPGTSEPGDALALLHDALRDGRTVLVEMVGGSGTLVRRELKPMRLEGGRLRALDPVREAELTVAVHRIASVEPLD
ncbi:XPB/Ssl2-like helicase family protein [Isoptericola sp. CG 20/1183]|uniref:XPB/Ssl2-like helicase family protein n=1 Tax=Isoptericola halotolerans TaxID=300560 RepID=A0ABX5EFE5_9MICO|nr:MULTISPECIES: helicase-associated domain-containing protein [Isoptericola]PRZ08128.1 XPB/Ssl2-like helicase family protein [Isoptericola halotolerans]PRZ08925.1 XPB/Ssl2-like helicase family protein [Isoptericola sp. CG 20/1183]